MRVPVSTNSIAADRGLVADFALGVCVLLPFLLLLSSLAIAADPGAATKHLNELNRQARWMELERAGTTYVREALARKDAKEAGRMQYYVCRALFERGQYGRALQAALTGRDYSLQSQDYAGAAFNNFGIAMIHLATNSFELGAEAGRQMLAYAARSGIDPAMFAILQAALLQGSGQPNEAIRLLRETLAQAEAKGNVMNQVEALGRIGALLQAQSPDLAEPYLVEAFRIAKLLYPKGLPAVYTKLARLRLAQNRPLESIRLAEQALLRPSEQVRRSDVYETIARAQLKLGRKPEALEQLRKAIATERTLFASLPFADDLQISRENSIQPRFELFALTAAALIAQRPNSSLVTEAFEVVQENRAASLRNRASADEAWRERLPDAYWQTLTELRRNAARQSAPDPHAENGIRRARNRLVEIESAAGVPGDLRSNFRATVPQLQSRLQPGDIAVGFLLAEPHSLRWVIDRNSIRMTPIASRAVISAAAARFCRHIQQSDPAHRASGAELAKLLFDGVPTRGSWTIIPDDALFTIPFAALSTPDTGGRYLVESVAIRLVPTAGFIEEPRAAARAGFLGFGDPVANRADPRLAGQPVAPGGPNLPRLPNSAEEVRRCSRLWPDHRVLSGPLPNLDSLRSALAAKPRVLHFATHVYRPAQQDSPRYRPWLCPVRRLECAHGPRYCRP